MYICIYVQGIIYDNAQNEESSMCLAVPGKIIEILDDRFVVADFMGVTKRIAVDLLESAELGEYIIVHAGFALEKLNEADALENIEYFKQILAEEDDAQT